MGSIISDYGVLQVIGIDRIVDVVAPDFILQTADMLVIRAPEDASYQINEAGIVGVMPAMTSFGIDKSVTSIKFQSAMAIEVMSR